MHAQIKFGCNFLIQAYVIGEHISYNDLIYNLCNALIIIRRLIKNICDMLNLTNMSVIKSCYFIRWRIIIRALQRLYIKPLQWIWSHVITIHVWKN